MPSCYFLKAQHETESPHIIKENGHFCLVGGRELYIYIYILLTKVTTVTAKTEAAAAATTTTAATTITTTQQQQRQKQQQSVVVQHTAFVDVSW